MKFIIAAIQPTKLSAVKNALRRIGVERLTVCDSQEFVPDSSIPILRGVDNRANVHRKVVLEIAVNDDFVECTMETIRTVAKTGRLGNDDDGQVLILPLLKVIQIADGCLGPGAI